MSVRQNQSNGNFLKPLAWSEVLISNEDISWSLLYIGLVLAASSFCGYILHNANTRRDTVVLATCLLLCTELNTLYHDIGRGSYIAALTICSLALGLPRAILSKTVRHVQQVEIAAADSKTHDEIPLRPLIFPCRTTHTRLFPTKHSFGYSYLLVGIPIGWTGRAGILLSAGRPSSKTWFTVHADDYLDRRRDARGLKAKLDVYLVSQEVLPSQYPHAYLVTAPRFLGFSFNPVSFWYLYDKHKKLAAMILEVNNTFDERRMYFMRRDAVSTADAEGVFVNSWSKDFHVSPFNDRGGSYSLTARDPFFTSSSGSVDNNIVLRNEDGKPKIVARVFSAGAAVNPSTVSSFQSWRFVIRWWWVGFMTNFRILKEARELWVKNLQVFYRPEVFVTSLGRNETSEEARLEPFFRRYLRRLVEDSDKDVSLNYIPAAGPDRGKSIPITSANSQQPLGDLEINILTPAFYCEVVRASSFQDAFEKFCFRPSPGSQMVKVDDVTKIKAMLPGVRQCGNAQVFKDTLLRYPFLFLRKGMFWRAMKTLIPGMVVGSKDIGDLLTDFDVFVNSTMPNLTTEYSFLTTRILLADRLALGFTQLLDFMAMVLWATGLLVTANTATKMMRQHSQGIEVFHLMMQLFIFHYMAAVWAGPKRLDE